MSTLFKQESGQTKKILGLDLGVTSIGWALIEKTYGEADDGSQDSGNVLGAGVRIYQPPFKLKESTETKKSYKNADRRKARGTRRRTERIRMRLDHLAKILRESQMLPKAGPEWDSLFHNHAMHPLFLRAKGLDEELSLHEFGRCLFHICKRRGFKSNKGIKILDLEIRRRSGRPAEFVDLDPEIRAVIDEDAQAKAQKASSRQSADEDEVEEASKKESADSADDEGVVLAAISELRRKMDEIHARTLGEYLFTVVSSRTEDGGWSQMAKVRGTRTARDMYEAEFELLWESQTRFHSKVLSDKLKAEVYKAIFFQRPLKVQRFLVGECQFEPNRKRARVGYPIAEEFRTWQDLNNLKLEGRRYDEKGKKNDTLFPDKELADLDLPVTRSLTQEEKERLASKLLLEEKLTWAAIRKELGKEASKCSFNLERTKTKGLDGARTRSLIEKTVPGLWDRLSSGEIVYQSGVNGSKRTLTVDNLMEDLFSISESGALLGHLRKYYGLSAKDAYHLATLDLPTKTMSLSSAAMRKILPFMKQGKGYTEAVESAGYLRRDQKTTEGQPKIPWEALAGDRPGKGGRKIPKINNPSVSKCVFQTRKVVNQIIRDHGVPDVIRVELAREMRNNQSTKEEITKAQRLQEKTRKEAQDKLKGLGMGPDNRVDIQKYQLWKEAGEVCPYTLRPISLTQLFSAETEIDHIIPWSISLDDSMKNKVVCYADANRQKSNKTPYQAFGANKEQFQKMIDWVESCKSFPRNKRQRFIYGMPGKGRAANDAKVELEFAAGRLLSDTSYMTRSVKEILLLLGCEVEPVKGGTTAVIRKKWGLNTLLQKPDPETGEVLDEKNRDDHRHHAIDAVVIALTDFKFVTRLSRLSAKVGGAALGEHDLSIPTPWAGFRDEVKQTVDRMLVSHEPNRKVTGALTEETVYGLDLKRMERTFRKPISNLTDKMLGQVRSPELRRRIEAAIKQAGDIKKAFPDGKLTYNLPNGKQVVVKTVVCAESVRGKVQAASGGSVTWPGYAPFRNREGNVIGWRATGGNHHLAIYEKANGERWAEAISYYEATERRRRGEPIYQDAANRDKLAIALHKDDMVEYEVGGNLVTYRVAMFSTVPNIYLCLRLAHDTHGGAATVVVDGGQRIVSNKYLGQIIRAKEN